MRYQGILNQDTITAWHGVLMVAKGMNCHDLSEIPGHSPRTLEYWVKQFNNRGLSYLVDRPRTGRPSRISDEMMEKIDQDLRHTLMILATNRTCGMDST